MFVRVHTAWLAFTALGMALLPAAPQARAQAAPPPSLVAIEFFFEPGCSECQRVREEVLPLLAQRYDGFYALRELDLGVKANYLRLVALMQGTGADANAHVYMQVGGRRLLAGFESIQAGLFPALEDAVASGDAQSPPATGPPAPGDEQALLAAQVSKFTLANVMLGGLVDGINPCAISTLVFLISVLAMARVRGWELAAVGIAFCLASFITYTAIGFGLLRALHLLSRFAAVQRVVDWALIAMLFVLAALSFRDAWRFRRSGRPGDVTLQLPDAIKGRIHRMLRTGLSGGGKAVSAFVLGAGVTALESVCTGQVYVPTLALVVKNGSDVWRGLGYLLLYNAMFIAPLVTVFILTLAGLKLFNLLEWSKRNVVVSKVLLGLFFLGLAVVFLLIA